MLFALGFIAGLATATLIVATLAYLRPMEQAARKAVTALGNAGPRQTGSVFVPKDEDEFARDEIVRENRERGLDTRAEDLM